MISAVSQLVFGLLPPVASVSGTVQASPALASSVPPPPPEPSAPPDVRFRASPAVRFQRPPSPNPILPIAAVSALMCAGCDNGSVQAVAEFFDNISAPTAGLLGALIMAVVASLVAPWMRAYSDVRFRASPAGTRRAAEGDLYRTLEMLDAVEKLPEKKIRQHFLHDLVEIEKEGLSKKKSRPIHGRTAEMESIFGSFLGLEQPSLVITGAPNSGMSTLIRAIAREVAKIELGQTSLCPPAWRGGRLYSLRFDRLMALNPDHRALILMAILAISRRDPQHVKLVIDNRPLLADSHVSSVMATILDAIQRNRIGAILAMTEDHYKELTKNGGSELEAHLRNLKLPRLLEADLGRVVMEAFTEQLGDLRERDPKFAKLNLTFAAFASDETAFLKALTAESAAPALPELGVSLDLARAFAVYLYKQFRKGRLPADGIVNGETAGRFLRERSSEITPT